MLHGCNSSEHPFILFVRELKSSSDTASKYSFFSFLLIFLEMQAALHQLLLPPNCAASSVVGYQMLRSGREAYCDGGWMVSGLGWISSNKSKVTCV